MNLSGEIENESRWPHQYICTCRKGVLLRDVVSAVFFFLAVSQGIHVCAGAWIRAALLIFLVSLIITYLKWPEKDIDRKTKGERYKTGLTTGKHLSFISQRGGT